MMYNQYEQLFRMYRLINLNEIQKLENLIKKKLNKKKKRTIFVFDRFANFFCDECLRSKGVNTMLNVLLMVGRSWCSCASATSRVASFIASFSLLSLLLVSSSCHRLFASCFSLFRQLDREARM